MKNEYIEITIHLINGEDIQYTISGKTDDAKKVIADYIDEDAHKLCINYEYGCVAYIDKRNILYIETKSEIFNFDGLMKAVRDYADEHE